MAFQDTARAQTMAQLIGASFAILADVHHAVADTYGVFNLLGEPVEGLIYREGYPPGGMDRTGGALLYIPHPKIYPKGLYFYRKSCKHHMSFNL